MSWNLDWNSSTTKTKHWNKIEDPVVPLERNICGHPLARLPSERKFEEMLFERRWEKYQHGNVLTYTKKLGFFLTVCVDDTDMVGKKQKMDTMWKIQQKDIDLEDPTPLLDQVYLGCAQWQAKVDHQAVQSKTESFKKLTMAREADEKDQRKENILWKRSLVGVLIWNAMPKKCVENYCEWAQKDVFTLQQVATPCIDDHQIPPGDDKMNGEFSAVCAQMVLKCLSWQELDDQVYCGQLILWHNQ